MIIGMNQNLIEKFNLKIVDKDADINLALISEDLDYCYLETKENFKYLFTLENVAELFELKKFKELMNESLLNSGINQNIINDYLETIKAVEFTVSKQELDFIDVIQQKNLINPFKEVQSQIMKKYNDIYKLNLMNLKYDYVSTRAYDIKVNYLNEEIFITVPAFYSLDEFVAVLNNELLINLIVDESEFDYLGFSKYTLLLDEVFDYKLAIKNLIYDGKKVAIELLDVRYDYKFLKYQVVNESDLKS